MRLLFFLSLLCMTAGNVCAQEEQWNVTVPKDILILQGTKDYNTALQTARQASARLGKKLDLEGNHPNRQLGLSLSKANCAGDAYDYPCYTARGDGAAQNSDYISIEYSNAYEGLAKGYYIVVAAITDPGSSGTAAALAAVRKHYKDAYAKRTRIWHGCMH